MFIILFTCSLFFLDAVSVHTSDHFSSEWKQKQQKSLSFHFALIGVSFNAPIHLTMHHTSTARQCNFHLRFVMGQFNQNLASILQSITFRHFTRTVFSQFMVRLVLVLHSIHSYIWQRPLTEPNSLSLIFIHAINHLKPPIHQQIKQFSTMNIPRGRSCQLAYRSYLIEFQSLTPN